MIRLSVLLVFLFFFKWSLSQEVRQPEFRGVWVATINNIDWPSLPGLPVEQQKKELIDLIDSIERFNLNAVFFQVRAAADAFYASDTEPWSYFLTGKQGKPTEPFFDPLAYITELCHAKGIEIHAWFNPFRVRNIGYYELAKNSFAAKNPQFVHDFDSKKFFDPGYPQVREHVIKVIMEVVRKYKIDGVILDDYFYPYPVRGKKFPDDRTFARHGKNFYPNRLRDWRRNNIDQLVSVLHDSIKNFRPSLKFGISPFGIWRNHADDPNGSPGMRGTTSYDDLYVDVNKWLSKNWIDYVVPQLYWEKGNRYADFESLAKWWNDHCFGKPLYLGQALFKSTDIKNGWDNPKEISDQIEILRRYKNIKGFAFYSASHLSRLTDTEMGELSARLTPLRKEPGIQATQTGAIVSVSAGDSSFNAQLGKSIFTDIAVFENKINISKVRNDNELKPPPGHFDITREHKKVTISWKPSDSLRYNSQRFALLVYQSVNDTGKLQKFFVLAQNKPIIVDKKTEFNPRKMIYRCAGIDDSGKDRYYSRLFRIRGKRIVYY